MSHLDDLAAALVDNELDHDARDRALSHITRCGPCRAEVDAQRRLKALLANQADPGVSFELTARLLVLSTTATGPANDVVRLRRRPRRRAATYSALSVALLAGVAVAGGQSTQPSVRPPVQSFVDEHNASTTRVGYLNDAGTVVMTSFGR